MGYSFFLSPILTCVSNKLGDFVVDKIKEHCALHSEVQCLQTFLEQARSAFRNAESDFSLWDTDDKFMESMSGIRKLVCEAEDALDTFASNIDRTTRKQEGSQTGRVSFPPPKYDEVQELCRKIKLINNKLDAISKASNICNFTKPEIRKHQNRYQRICNIRKGNLKVDDKDIVGFTEEREKIKELLHDKDTGRSVISIVGMGGSGKTTIAHQLYRAEERRAEERRAEEKSDEFVYEVFVCVNIAKTNSTYEEKSDEFVKVLIAALKGKNDEFAKAALNIKIDGDEQEVIYTFLSQKRYLILLDDVWDLETWEMISKYFPRNNNKSRLMITTRSMRVARAAGSSIIKLNALNDQDSMQLLKSGQSNEDFPEEKTDELNSMLKLCHGLPLAILELRKKLCARGHHNWWEVKRYGDNQQNEVKGIKWSLDRDTINCLEIIGLSYNDLELQWKFCFLYFSAFPEHFEIDVNKLIRLWVAENFIIPENGTELEHTARRYLNELIDRNMVQVVVETSKLVQIVKIHGVLLDLCILKAKQVFLATLDGGNICMESEIVRRIALHKWKDIYKNLNDDNALCLRTLLCFVSFTYDFKKFKLLRILHMTGKSINELPEHIDDLIQLRYLGLTGDDALSSPPTDDLTARQILDKNDIFWKLRGAYLQLNCISWKKLRGENLPFLHTLYLEKLVDIENITVSDISFPKLEVFILKSLKNLESLYIENGAMNSLKFLKLKCCRKLKMISAEDGALKELKHIEVEGCCKLKRRSDLLEDKSRQQMCGTGSSNGQDFDLDINTNQTNTGAANASNEDMDEG